MRETDLRRRLVFLETDFRLRVAERALRLRLRLRRCLLLLTLARFTPADLDLRRRRLRGIDLLTRRVALVDCRRRDGRRLTTEVALLRRLATRLLDVDLRRPMLGAITLRLRLRRRTDLRRLVVFVERVEEADDTLRLLARDDMSPTDGWWKITILLILMSQYLLLMLSSCARTMSIRWR